MLSRTNGLDSLLGMGGGYGGDDHGFDARMRQHFVKVFEDFRAIMGEIPLRPFLAARVRITYCHQFCSGLDGRRNASVEGC